MLLSVCFFAHSSSATGEKSNEPPTFATGTSLRSIILYSVRWYGGDGIRISSTGTTVRDNQINANTRYGVYADGLNLLFDGNRIAGNTSDGMHFITPGNVLRGNVLMGNDNPLGGPEGSGQTDGGGNLPPLIPE